MREKYGLAIPMMCTGEYYGQDRLSFADPDDTIKAEAIARFKKGIDVAQQLGCFINLGRVRGGYTPDVDQAWTRKRIFEALQDVTSYAEQTGVVIVLEPVNTLALNYINTTQEGIELVKQLNSPSFQLMVDTAHLHIEDRDIRKSMEEGAPYIKYVYLADSNRKYLGGGVLALPLSSPFLEISVIQDGLVLRCFLYQTRRLHSRRVVSISNQYFDRISHV